MRDDERDAEPFARFAALFAHPVVDLLVA